MKIDRVGFVLSNTVVRVGSEIWNHFEKYLRVHGFRIDALRRIYDSRGTYGGTIQTRRVFVDRGHSLEKLCQRYNPPNYSPKHDQCLELK